MTTTPAQLRSWVATGIVLCVIAVIVLGRCPIERAVAEEDDRVIPSSTQQSLWNDLLDRASQSDQAYRIDEAIRDAGAALQEAERTFGESHPNVAVCLNALGLYYVQKEQYAEAQPLLERALAIRNEVLGPRHVDTGESLNSLAGLMFRQHAYVEAEPLYQKCLAIWNAQLPADDFRLVLPLTALGYIATTKSEYAKAQSLYGKALDIMDHNAGVDPLIVASCASNLANVHAHRGRYDLAAPLLERAVTLYDSAPGNHSDKVLEVLRHYSTTLRKLGKISEVIEVENRIKKLSL